MGIVGLILSGCGQQAPLRADQVTREGYTANSPYIVMDSPALQQGKQAWGAPPPGRTPWWTVRNDEHLNIRRNPTPQAEGYRIYTRDLQSTHGDHIHDHYRRRSYTIQTPLGR